MQGNKMKILITGSNGFIGKNLFFELQSQGYQDIYLYDSNSNPELLDQYTKNCDFVYHLAGVNRAKNDAEFIGNIKFTSKLLNNLKMNNNKAPILITSSIQAELDNPYGKSKKACEDLIFEYGNNNDVKTFVYRLTNVFGKWSRPNYNTVIATFCYNIARKLPIKIHDSSTKVNLVYIDEVVNELINALYGKEKRKNEFCLVPVSFTRTLGEIADLIYSFKRTRETLAVPDMSDIFTRNLYSTYLSFIPEDEFSYPLKMNIDQRGSFTEIIRTAERGQFSVNRIKPGITKGNHWHHSKNEKFIVVSGNGVIRFRKVGEYKIFEYHVKGDILEIVDIPSGYTHNIENSGDQDMVVIMWVNECFDPDKPDTHFLEV